MAVVRGDRVTFPADGPRANRHEAQSTDDNGAASRRESRTARRTRLVASTWRVVPRRRCACAATPVRSADVRLPRPRARALTADGGRLRARCRARAPVRLHQRRARRVERDRDARRHARRATAPRGAHGRGVQSDRVAGRRRRRRRHHRRDRRAAAGRRRRAHRRGVAGRHALERRHLGTRAAVELGACARRRARRRGPGDRRQRCDQLGRPGRVASRGCAGHAARARSLTAPRSRRGPARDPRTARSGHEADAPPARRRPGRAVDAVGGARALSRRQ
jgi:hypothetical protein